MENYSQEILWAEIFRSVTDKSTWLKNRSFAPGRWALGYPALYILYRILNEMKPKAILELGLGQSTRMISQYTGHYKGIKHLVVEHDEDWIQFFKKDFKLNSNTHIKILGREFIDFKEAKNVRVFSGFQEEFSNDSFDFIMIDAPLGGDMKDYARIDVLRCMPQILNKSFIILIDDFNRIGEQNTVKAMENLLKDTKISYKTGVYSGVKDTLVICSEDNKFFTSL